jgi:short-subunit dehydrogenase
MRVEGRTVVLTGATGGIGRALALTLARAGARLILVARDAAALELLARALPVQGQSHEWLAVDLMEEKDRLRLRELCEGRHVSVLVNNAGASGLSFLADCTFESIERQLTLNLAVPVLLTRLLLPQLLAQKEALVVNIGSAFGSIGYPGFSVYCASKFGLRGFSEALRRELADTSVHVLHVAPRATRTALNSEKVVAMNHALGNAMDDPIDVARQVLQRIERGRWGSVVLGWPERLYAFINAVLPAMTDNTLRKQLPVIRRFARAPQSTVSERETPTPLSPGEMP